MNEKDKELLLKDLCGRLPYGVKVKRIVHVTDKDTIESIETLNLGWLSEYCATQCEIKPYLRPMSSMTEEERKELEDEINKDFKLAIIACKENDISKSTSGFYKIDWLNAHHFDYRGLIEKGLALEALEGMYKMED